MKSYKDQLIEAHALVRKGDFESAQTLLSDVTESEVVFERARIELLADRPHEAWEILAPLIAQHPREAGLWVEAARIARSFSEAEYYVNSKFKDLPAPLQALVEGVLTGEGLRFPKLKGADLRLSRDVESQMKPGQFKKALTLLTQKSDPKNPVFAIMKAQIFLRLGDVKSAEHLAQSLLKSFPFHGEALSLAARLQAKKGQVGLATQTALKAAELAPKNANAVKLALKLCLETGALIAARATLREAKKLGLPKKSYLHEEARLLLAEGYPRDAGDLLAQSAASFEELGFVAQAYNNARSSDKALQFFDRALKKQKDVKMLIEKAQLLQTVGENDQAEGILCSVLQQDPSNGRAFRAYAYGAKRRLDDPFVQKAQALESSSDDLRSLLYGFAKVGFDARNAQVAWGNLHKANRQTADAYPYGLEADRETYELLVGAVSETLQNRKASIDQEASPIFVTGMPRSGTTLVEQIIGAHSHVVTGGELGVAGPSLEVLKSQLALGIPVKEEMLVKSSEAYLSRAGQKLPTKYERFTDKSINNFSQLGLLQAILPKAKFVVVRRDPRDVALSIYRNQFPDGNQRYATSLTQIADYYRLFEDFLSHWKRFGVSFYEISYEALVSDPEAQTRALISACELPWEEKCLAFHENKKARIDTLSFAQARGPISQGSKGGWKVHEEELQPFIERAQELCLTLPAE